MPEAAIIRAACKLIQAACVAKLRTTAVVFIQDFSIRVPSAYAAAGSCEHRSDVALGLQLSGPRGSQ
jgi:hypothetical protein